VPSGAPRPQHTHACPGKPTARRPPPSSSAAPPCPCPAGGRRPAQPAARLAADRARDAHAGAAGPAGGRQGAVQARGGGRAAGAGAARGRLAQQGAREQEQARGWAAGGRCAPLPAAACCPLPACARPAGPSAAWWAAANVPASQRPPSPSPRSWQRAARRARHVRRRGALRGAAVRQDPADGGVPAVPHHAQGRLPGPRDREAGAGGAAGAVRQARRRVHGHVHGWVCLCSLRRPRAAQDAALGLPAGGSASAGAAARGSVARVRTPARLPQPPA
jgi:hypothetical protein